ncbi:abc transporter [Naegleria gruberi]|uniref:Abc transporter n=1 Tax=Naegleria gruberi TaxID=5762 RepID=D2VIT2_NAEGR|nr:abc transporter [Naegleria gruberi]EFC43329.1 abc transporter [Naegleria gruberi]|eukprot:XP_002676073.1 abc transporter [Naegleria gruberi strain NEG-M]
MAPPKLSTEEEERRRHLEQEVTSSLPFHKELGEVIINAKGIYKHYNIAGRTESVRALEEINVNDESEFYGIRRGEFVMIRGPSGGGKTTLLNIIGTIDKPSGGTLEILGEPITSKSSDNYLADLRLRRIGFVFQTFNLIATMSAFENVELPMTLLGKLNKKERRKRAKELLRLVGLEDRMAHLPSELSGGEQQRVTIARALANEPEILLLDEPTGDLDTKNTVEIMDLLLRINLNKKTTCVMVTHNPDVETYADRVLFVSDGRFVEQALNEIQVPLIFENYSNFLKSK